MATQELPKLTLPSKGEVRAEVEDPAHLSSQQWVEDIIVPMRLMKGWCIDGDIPQLASEIAFELNRNTTMPNFQRYPTALVETSLVYTERSSKFISSGFDKETVAASYDFVSGSAQHAHSERRESQSEQRMLYITGFWNITTARLWFKPGESGHDIQPTAAFNEAVDRALESDSLTDQYSRLCQVFKDYGQVFATQVTLGGQLFFQHNTSCQSITTEEQETRTVEAAVNVKIGKFAGEAEAEVGTSTDEYQKAIGLAETLRFLAHGGNQLYAQTPDIWLESLAQHDKWYPISLQGIMPIYELLDEARKTKIKKVLDFVMSDPPMRLRRFTKEAEEKGQHHATCTLTVPPGYKLISGGARVIDDQPSDQARGTILNMLWASYPTEVGRQDAWRAESWDCKRVNPAHIEISAIALYDPDNEWDVKVFKSAPSGRSSSHNISVSVDKGYYLTGGGAEIFDSTVLEHDLFINSFLISSYPSSDKTWTALSHDHLRRDFHDLRVYAIGVKPRNGRTLDIQLYSQKSGEVEKQYPDAEVKPADDYALVGGGAGANKEVDHHLLTSYSFTTSDTWRATGWKARSTDHERSQPAILTAYAIGVKGAIYPGDLPDE